MKRVKPFDDLMYFPTTLGMEAATESYRTKLDPEGLCVCPYLYIYPNVDAKPADDQNAVIIAAPDSRFIDRWLESYQTYEEGSWAHHSVVVPWVCYPIPKSNR
jgi:hypothetical protein